MLHCIKHGRTRSITYSNPLLGAPHNRQNTIKRTEDGMWIRTKYEVLTERPKIVEVGAKYFNAVDLNDRYRQGYFNMEDSWRSQRCWVRVFTTVFGIILDCYLGDVRQEHDVDRRESCLSFFGFLAELAHGLIINTVDRDINISSSSNNLRSKTTSSNEYTGSPELNIPQLKCLSRTEYVQQRIGSKLGITNTEDSRFKKALSSYQLRCSVCGAKASQYCHACSTARIGEFVVCCSSKTKKIAGMYICIPNISQLIASQNKIN